MATPYSDIYDLYFGAVSDYDFLQLPETTQDDILEGWLLNAVAEFYNCKKDLSDRDGVLKLFNRDLDDDEKSILAKYLLVSWLSPKLYSQENLKNHLSTKDYKLYSPANLLKEIRYTHDKALSEANRARTAYGYKHFNPLEDLK